MTLKVLLIVLLIALIVAGVYSVRNQLWVAKTFGCDYVVVMKDGAKLPDLASLPTLKEKLDLSAHQMILVAFNHISTMWN